jgi:hypothetical protein
VFGDIFTTVGRWVYISGFQPTRKGPMASRSSRQAPARGGTCEASPIHHHAERDEYYAKPIERRHNHSAARVLGFSPLALRSSPFSVPPLPYARYPDLAVGPADGGSRFSN